MFPVLFSIGKLNVSSYGVLLVLGFLIGVFLIWRLSRAWDLDEEKVLDLTFVSFFGGIIGARIFFILANWQLFAPNPLTIIQFIKYPGFSFWGAFLGGWLSIAYISRKVKIDFWQIADIASIGFLVSIIFSNIGCFLGGCNVGIVSNFLSTPVIGLAGSRFPTQLLEAALLSLVVLKLWSQATHFHQRGKVVSLSLIYLGLIQVFTQPLRVSNQDFYFSTTLIILGITIFYRVMKRSLKLDLKSFVRFSKGLFVDEKCRKILIQTIGKEIYNQKVNIAWKIRAITKLLKKTNVKFSHKNSKFN